MKRKVSFGLILGASLGILVVLFVRAFRLNSLPDHIACVLEQSIVIANQGKAVVVPDTLYIQIPEEDARQQVKFLGLEPEDHQISTAEDCVIVRDLRRLMPGQELRIKYSLMVKTRQCDYLRDQQVNPGDTAPELDIESDSELIILKAEELSRNTESAEEKAHRFYEYVAGHIDFNVEMEAGTRRSALECLQRQEGVCGHKANLLTALCRASGIPSQIGDGLHSPEFRKTDRRPLLE